MKRQAFATLALCQFLAGCLSAPSPKAAPAIKRFPLNEAQEAAVKTAMANAFPGNPNPEFLHMDAGTDPTGIAYLCGRVRVPGGSFTGATPFMIKLGSKNEVEPVAVGGNAETTAKVVAMCREKGLI